MRADDPILQRLVAAVARTTAALNAYVGGGDADDPADDLVSIKQAAYVFGKSEDTIRRWAVDEGMGVQPGGRNTSWLISRAAIMQVKRAMPRQNAQPCPTDASALLADNAGHAKPLTQTRSCS